MAATVPVKQDSRGVWYSRIYLGKDSKGKKIQAYRSFPEATSEADARVAAAIWASDLTADGRVRSTVLTDMLADYIEMREINGASPNSVKQWRQFLRCYITRFLRGKRADELTALDFTRFNGVLLRHGSRDGKPLSPNTVNAVYQFLRGAYRYFVSVGLVETNPLLAAVKPYRDQDEAIALEEDDVAVLNGYLDPIVSFEVEVGDIERRNAFAAWLALHTGARCGEVCAVRPKDVYQKRGYIHIGGTVVEPGNEQPYRKEKPKSSTSRRNISLVPEELEVIVRFMAWHETKKGSARDMGIASVDGTWARPSTLSSWFKRLVEKLDLDRQATFHTLRHTHASWCLAHGIDVVTLSERLGHSSPAITIRIYGHMLQGRDMAAAETFYKAIQGGV